MQLKFSKYIAVLATVATFGISGCDKSTEEVNSEARDSILEKATKAEPVPQISNFQNRAAIAEYMKRMDDPSKTFYAYILSMRGDVIGYYVLRTHPVSVCEVMTPPVKEYYVYGNPNPLGNAPTLNGTYGTGDGNCSHYYAFTADTDTLIEFSQDFFISDAPLPLEADNLSPK